MSFSAEMKDFFNAFQTTSAVVDAAQTRKLRREKLEGEKEYGLDDWDDGYSGPQSIALPEVEASDTTEVDTDTGETENDDIAIPPVIDPNEDKVYGPDKPPSYYAGGGAIRTGTQKGRLPVDMSRVNKNLIAKWKKTQKDFGRELNIVSAYRSPKRNKKAGGAKKSQHIHGNAFDIDVSGLSKPERLELIKIASANGISGIGVYNNSLHFDVGGRRSWGPDYSDETIPGWAKGTIDQHLAGKFGGYSRPKTTPNREVEYETASGPVSALPVDTAEASDWRSRLMERFGAREEDDFGSALSFDNDEDQGNEALAEFYDNEGIDVSAIDIPEPAAYRAGDMTAIPQPVAYAATGGSVPWAGQTSYVRRRTGGPTGGPMGSYFQRRPYVPRQSSASQLPVEEEKKTANNPWNDNAMEYILKYQRIYPPEYVNWVNNAGLAKSAFAWNPAGKMIYGLANGAFADGGTVPSEEDLDAGASALDLPIPKSPSGADDLEADTNIPKSTPGRQDLEDPSALPDPNAVPRQNRESLRDRQRPRGRVTLGEAIDRGLKFLTRSLGLDRAAAAVGPDQDLKRRRKMLVDGAVGMGEGPPTPDEMKEVFRTVDPNGQLDESLRSIYAMRKGVEFYLKRGDDVKAAKWAANLIQFSNLVARQYGVEAVKAGQAGDTESMMRLAVKSYDAIPDGLSAQAELNNGKVKVTRKDEEGNVVDIHDLSPQQVFQMATGISAGSGYFDALMDVANRGRKPAGKAAADPAKLETRKGALRSRFKSVAQFANEGDREAFEQALEAEDFQTANDIVRDAAAARPQAEKPLTPAQEAAKKTAEVRTSYYQKLFPGIKGEMTEDELAAWEVASTANEPVSLKELYDDVSSRLTKKQQQAQKTKKIAGLKALREDYEEDLSPAQQKALDAAFEENDTDTIDRIYGDIDQVRRDEQRATESETRFNRQQEAITTRAEEAAARKTAEEEKRAKTKALEDAKLKSPSRRDLENIELEVDGTIRSLFTQDSGVEDEYIPQEVDNILGKGAYQRIRGLATSIAAYNDLPVENSFGFMTDILTSPEEVNLSKDEAGNLVIESPSGQIKLPGSDEAKVKALMGGGVEIEDTLGYGYTTRRTREGEEAIPATPPAATPAPSPVTSESNAGRPMPPNVEAKARQAIREGRSREGVIRKLREQGYNPAGL